MTNHATRMFNATVRIERMFWLPGVATSVPDDFNDFIRDDLANSKGLLKQLPWLKRFVNDKDFQLSPEEYPAEFWRNGCNGFLVLLARPIPRDFHKDGRGYSFSWGHYQTEWFYFETLEEMCAHAEKWSEQIVDRERRKLRSRQKTEA